MEQKITMMFSGEATMNGNTLSGYAHVFGNKAKVHGMYETIRPGAFDKALKKSDVRAFYQHDQKLLLGRQSNNTLRVSADEKGLAFEIDLPNTSYANDLRELIARGDLNEMSFAFIPGDATYSKSPDGLMIRSHTSVRELVDISPVTIPAFAGTSINMRGKSYSDESLKSQIIRAKAKAIKGEM